MSTPSCRSTAKGACPKTPIWQLKSPRTGAIFWACDQHRPTEWQKRWEVTPRRFHPLIELIMAEDRYPQFSAFRPHRPAVHPLVTHNLLGAGSRT